MKTFRLYAIIGPLLLTPLSFWAWWTTYQHNMDVTLLAWGVPIIYAYLVPGLGTNMFKVWEFTGRFKLGRMRWQHGFVFGSATGLLAWLCHFGWTTRPSEALGRALVCGLVLALCNTLYDIGAIRSGVLRVYNQPWAEGRDAKAIVLDYAPWFFGAFGIVYSVGLSWAETVSRGNRLDLKSFIAIYVFITMAVVVIPVSGYCFTSLFRHGHTGCRPITPIRR